MVVLESDLWPVGYGDAGAGVREVRRVARLAVDDHQNRDVGALARGQRAHELAGRRERTRGICCQML